MNKSAKEYLFTSESVSEGHPDKVADQISDAILDAILEQDPTARVAAETLCTTGTVMLAGEISTTANVDYTKIVRDTLKRIGYDDSSYGIDHKGCAVLVAYDKQSPDIAQGVDKAQDDPLEKGAGDQGLMFGYACDETDALMPAPIYYAHRLVEQQSLMRRTGEMPYLRPDAKSQVTVEYGDDGRPLRIDTIVVSTQHDEFIEPLDNTPDAQAAADRQMQQTIEKDVREVLVPRVMARYGEQVQRLLDMDTVKLYVNPTGKFVIGGPHGDTGLTGRKIIVDTYGGRGAHGGGAFSGKDPSKVDRSAAYALRHIARNLVAAGVARQALVQAAYAIGKPEPVSVAVNTYGTARVPVSDAEIAAKVRELVPLTPHAIEKRLNLRQPMYLETAAYGHMGRTPRRVTKWFHDRGREPYSREVELFTWEKEDLVPLFRTAFGLDK